MTRKKILSNFLFLISIFIVLGIFQTPAKAEALNSAMNAPAASKKEFHGALGLGGVKNTRHMSNEHYFSQFVPELVAYGYSHLKDSFWLRHSFRLSYAWGQPEMAQSLQIVEKDWKLVAETGIVWNWIVVPSLSFGFGSIYRSTTLKVLAPIQIQDSQISEVSFLPVFQAQIGIGIPMERGIIVVEPYLRYSTIMGDHRYNWAVGTEATIAVF